MIGEKGGFSLAFGGDWFRWRRAIGRWCAAKSWAYGVARGGQDGLALQRAYSDCSPSVRRRSLASGTSSHLAMSSPFVQDAGVASSQEIQPDEIESMVCSSLCGARHCSVCCRECVVPNAWRGGSGVAVRAAHHTLQTTRRGVTGLCAHIARQCIRIGTDTPCLCACDTQRREFAWLLAEELPLVFMQLGRSLKVPCTCAAGVPYPPDSAPAGQVRLAAVHWCSARGVLPYVVCCVAPRSFPPSASLLPLLSFPLVLLRVLSLGRCRCPALCCLRRSALRCSSATLMLWTPSRPRARRNRPT